MRIEHDDVAMRQRLQDVSPVGHRQRRQVADIAAGLRHAHRLDRLPFPLGNNRDEVAIADDLDDAGNAAGPPARFGAVSRVP